MVEQVGCNWLFRLQTFTVDPKNYSQKETKPRKTQSTNVFNENIAIKKTYNSSNYSQNEAKRLKRSGRISFPLGWKPEAFLLVVPLIPIYPSEWKRKAFQLGVHFFIRTSLQREDFCFILVVGGVPRFFKPLDNNMVYSLIYIFIQQESMQNKSLMAFKLWRSWRPDYLKSTSPFSDVFLKNMLKVSDFKEQFRAECLSFHNFWLC